MSDPINFDIEALAARYELHPERRDVFVEGDCDIGLVRKFLEDRGLPEVSVFPVSVVNVSPAACLGRSLPHPSVRSEVIALAMEFAQRGVSPHQAVCVADADMDSLLSRRVTCPLLLLTDFTSMELYAFSEGPVKEVLLVVCPRARTTARGVLDQLVGPLESLFLARAANCDLGFGLAWIRRIEKFLRIDEHDRLIFDETEFMRRYAAVRLPAAKLEALEARLDELRNRPCTDPRLRIHGHDFLRALAWFLRKVEKCDSPDDSRVRQLLYLATGTADLAEHTMFRALLARLTEPVPPRAAPTE